MGSGSPLRPNLRYPSPILLLSLSLACTPAKPPRAAGPGDSDPATTPETIPGDDSAPPGDLAPTRLNEALADNHRGFEDGDGDQVDWIELFNSGDVAVDLAGYHLSDDPGAPEAWTFPAVIVDPSGFPLVYASGKGDKGPVGELHTPFKLDATGETLVLSDPAGAEVSRLVFAALAEDRAYGLSQPVTELPVKDRLKRPQSGRPN